MILDGSVAYGRYAYYWQVPLEVQIPLLQFPPTPQGLPVAPLPAQKHSWKPPGHPHPAAEMGQKSPEGQDAVSIMQLARVKVGPPQSVAQSHGVDVGPGVGEPTGVEDGVGVGMGVDPGGGVGLEAGTQPGSVLFVPEQAVAFPQVSA